MARWQKSSWIETLDLLPGLNLEEKARARIIILSKPRDDRELYFEGTFAEAAATIKALLRETPWGSTTGSAAARSCGSGPGRQAWADDGTAATSAGVQATSSAPAKPPGPPPHTSVRAMCASAPVPSPEPPPDTPRLAGTGAATATSTAAAAAAAAALPTAWHMGAINAAALTRALTATSDDPTAAAASGSVHPSRPSASPASPASVRPAGSTRAPASTRPASAGSAVPSAITASSSASRVRWAADSPSVLGSGPSPGALSSMRSHTPALSEVASARPPKPPPPPLGGWASINLSGEPPPPPEPEPLTLSILWSRTLGGFDSTLATRPSGWWDFASASTSAASSCRPSATQLSQPAAPNGGPAAIAATFHHNGYAETDMRSPREGVGGSSSPAAAAASAASAASAPAAPTAVSSSGQRRQPGVAPSVPSPFAAPAAFRLACAASAFPASVASSTASSGSSTSRRQPASELLVEAAATVRHLSALPAAFRAAHLRAGVPGDIYCRTVRKVMETSGAGRAVARHARFVMVVDFVERNTAVLIRLRTKEISRRPWKDDVAGGGGGTSVQCYRCEVVPDPSDSLPVLLERLEAKRVKMTDVRMWRECPAGWHLWDGVPMETGVRFEKG